MGLQAGPRCGKWPQPETAAFQRVHGANGWQTVCLALLGGLFAGAAIFAPREALVIYSAALSLMFLLTISLRLAAAAHAAYVRVGGRKRPIPRIKEAELPRYTVLVAMYKEARVLPDLVAALEALDYPPAKLDIKLVLEEVDAETIAAANALRLPPHFEVVVVPDGAPRTKPRALNYALQFATGDYLVIYDAGGPARPGSAPQSRRTLPRCAARGRMPAGAADLRQCIGELARRNNSPSNMRRCSQAFCRCWMRRGCPCRSAAPRTISAPAFSARSAPGIRTTSPRMPISASGSIGEVSGRRCSNSTTYEEAACQPGNWLRQRTRWLKGWVQTYAVHMRQPFRLARELGLGGFLAFQGHFAGIIIAALVSSPLLRADPS